MPRCSIQARATQNCLSTIQRQVRQISSAHEAITIPSASNGSIQLKVYHPATSSAHNRVAIYLPRGPICSKPEHDASNVEKLRSVVSCHVVQIQYRYGRQREYPTPVHDVVAGFDWAVTNLLPKRAITRAGRSEHVGKLAVCGELLGGSLAAALALTECRAGEPGIVAAAVNSPIVDWVDLSRAGTSQSPSPSPSLAETLLDQRSRLFRKPEHYFDPFASPALFFRTADREIPRDIRLPAMTEMDELAQLQREEYLREQQPLVGKTDVQDPNDQLSGENVQVRQRKSSRRYPPKALALQLPSFNITSGKQSPLLDQARELVHLLKQSFERQSKPGSSDGWTDKVWYEQHPGLALWDDTAAGRDRMQEVAAWIAEELSN